MTRRRFLPTFATRLLVCVLLAFSVQGSARQTSPRQTPVQSPSIAQVFEIYESGRYAEAIERLRPLGQALVLEKRLREEGPLWVAAGAPDTREHRRQVAAAMALEAAHLVFADPGVSRPFRGGFRGASHLERPFLGRDILELGCEWLRQGPPTEFEHLWMLASIAVVHSVLNLPDSAPSVVRNFTDPEIEPPGWWLLMRRMDSQHREHVAARHSNEPRVRLAAVLAQPEARRLSNRPGTTATFITEGYAGEVTSRWRTEAQPGGVVGYERERENAKWVGKVIDQLAALVSTPGIGAEARVRRGILFFHRADLAGALRDLQQAAVDADDPIVAYMAHFYAGLTLDNLNQRAAAIDEFTAAVKTIPNARSGALALAADLFLLDHRDEAALLVDSTLAAPAPNDPWRTFSLADYRFWPGYVTRLREAVRQ